MSLEQLYLLQLLGAVAIGGFVGEFFRAAHFGVCSSKVFAANFLAGSFLSFLVAYMLYSLTQQRQLSIIAGALLSYQKHEFITKLAQELLELMVRKGANKE